MLSSPPRFPGGHPGPSQDPRSPLGHLHIDLMNCSLTPLLFSKTLPLVHLLSPVALFCHQLYSLQDLMGTSHTCGFQEAGATCC